MEVLGIYGESYERFTDLITLKKNFVPHCPEALRYAKVWGRDVVRSLTLAYAKRLFLDSNP